MWRLCLPVFMSLGSELGRKWGRFGHVNALRTVLAPSVLHVFVFGEVSFPPWPSRETSLVFLGSGCPQLKPGLAAKRSRGEGVGRPYSVLLWGQMFLSPALVG